MLIEFENTDSILKEGVQFTLPLPLLGPRKGEVFPIEGSYSREDGPFHIWDTQPFTFGMARSHNIDDNLSETVETLYAALFELTQNQHLYRIWNYLPGINRGYGDEERYKQFCYGRSLAFENQYGGTFQSMLPAGSCVGIDGNEYFLVFLAGSAVPRHYENLNQVPAYQYPREYGIKPPSFARATTVVIPPYHYRFISGTAAIEGSKTMGVNKLREQLEITCKNLDLVGETALASCEGVAGKPERVTGKVYLRRKQDLEETRAFLQERYPAFENSFIYLRSDICRETLLVEIEFTIKERLED